MIKPLVRNASRAVQVAAHRLLWARTVAAIAAQDRAVPLLVALDGDVADLPEGAWRQGRRVRVVAQRCAGFAERLEAALAEVAGLGVERVVVVGTDTPGLDGAGLRRAVIAPGPVCGPAPDGGVYLFALDLRDTGRLRGVPWQTDRVAETLRDRLPGARWLAALADLDRPVAAEVLWRLLRRDPPPVAPLGRQPVDRRRLHHRLVHVEANAPPA